MRKVRIKGLPKKAHGGPTGGASDGIRRFMEGNKNFDSGMNQFAEPDFKVNKSISAVDPSEANIEAEGGEIAVVPGMGGIPESYKINGPRHAQGGVPLNLAEDSFIFSDFRDMKIKDRDILAEFGVSVPKKGRVKGKTPAKIAERFDLNTDKEVLLRGDGDTIENETAELNIKNKNMKLGKLALVQESMKGFPQGVPVIAQAYLQSIEQDPEQFAEQPQQPQPMQAAYGAGVVGDPSQYSYGYGGENRKMAKRFPGLDVKQRGGQYSGAFWDSILQGGGTVTEPNIDEIIFGTSPNVDARSEEVIMGNNQEMAVPENWKDDFYHETYKPIEGENPYYKTFGDRFRNTFKMFQPKRKPRVRQYMSFQDGGSNEQAMYDYMNQYGFTGDQITVGDKEIDLTHKRYKPYHYTGKFKGKKQDRPFLEGKPISTDSIANVPGVDPEQMRVHWSKSGKPTPVGPGASKYIQEHGNYYSKGLSNPEIFPSFSAPEQVVTAPSPYKQGGGNVKSVETIPNFTQMTPGQREGYNTAMDKFMTTKKTPEQQEAYRKLIERLHAQGNYDIKAGADSVGNYYNPPIVEENPEFQRGGQPRFDSPEADAQFIKDFVNPDLEITGDINDPTSYVKGNKGIKGLIETIQNKGLAETEFEEKILNAKTEKEAERIVIEMTPEEITEANNYIKGFSVKSLRKQLKKEDSEFKRNNTWNGNEYVPNGELPQEVLEMDAKTVDKNVKTTDRVVWDVPETATIHDFNDKYNARKTKVGDYIRYPDGSYKKIEENKLVKKGTSASGPGNYKPTYGSIEEDVAKAKEILKKGEMSGAFTLGTTGKNKGKWITNRHAKDILTISEKDLLTQVSQYRGVKGDLGALDLHFGTQKSGGDNFYGFADGEMLEYKYWQANNPQGTADEFEQLEHEDMLANRKSFLKVVGGYKDDEITALENANRLVTPGDLYTKEFMTSTKDKQGFTSRLEEGFGKDSGFRKALGNDAKIGMDHLDTFQIDMEQKLSDVGKKEFKEPSVIEKADSPYYDRSSTDAPWWAQDVGNMMMTLGERASIKKYLPHSFPLDLARPDVVYYDPSRALAANAEQANIAAQAATAFAGPQSTYQLTGIQGQGFQQAANTLADYEAKNVGLANQYLDKVKRTQDEENIQNVQRMKQLFDETTIANQQYDNSKRAANRNIFDAWRQGLTNATKTQTMNMLYPQYNIDPMAGGITHFTEGRDQTQQTPPGSASNNYAKSWKNFRKQNPNMKEETAYKVFRDSQGLTRGRGNSQRPQRDQFRDDYFYS